MRFGDWQRQRAEAEGFRAGVRAKAHIFGGPGPGGRGEAPSNIDLVMSVGGVNSP